jgi:hypothetical protein
LNESHKLDPWPVVEGSRPRSDKSRVNLHGTIFVIKSIGLNPKKKKELERRERFEEPRCKLGSKALTQGFNLLQMSPNWFLIIWTFAHLERGP